MTPADYCRAQGWQVGDVLQSQHGAKICQTTIVVTAIGLMRILVWRKNGPQYDEQWDFYGRNWQKVGHMDPFADKLIWPE